MCLHYCLNQIPSYKYVFLVNSTDLTTAFTQETSDDVIIYDFETNVNHKESSTVKIIQVEHRSSPKTIEESENIFHKQMDRKLYFSRPYVDLSQSIIRLGTSDSSGKKRQKKG